VVIVRSERPARNDREEGIFTTEADETMEQIEQFSSGVGGSPGIEHDEIVDYPVEAGPATITCIDYSADNVLMQEINDLEAFIGEHRPEWSAVRWINVEGLSNLKTVQALAIKYDLHPLAVEDILHNRQRPKIESYGGEDSEYLARLFIVARILRIREGALVNEQFSMFVGHRTVLTFQQTQNELWNPIYQRIREKGSRLRRNDASFLAYALLDALADSYYPILEYYSDLAEVIEDFIIDRIKPDLINEIHQLKRDLMSIHRMLWPLRDVVSTLQRDTHECMSDTSRVYLRDLYDHVIQVIEIVETYREISSDLTETYMSSLSTRMNEVMKVLTIIGTIFIPLTFLAGVYGMNFRYFPELNQAWGYPAFWGVCITVAAVMLTMFRKRGWL
jgi:magnesium transporter